MHLELVHDGTYLSLESLVSNLSTAEVDFVSDQDYRDLTNPIQRFSIQFQRIRVGDSRLRPASGSVGASMQAHDRRSLGCQWHRRRILRAPFLFRSQGAGDVACWLSTLVSDFSGKIFSGKGGCIREESTM